MICKGSEIGQRQASTIRKLRLFFFRLCKSFSFGCYQFKGPCLKKNSFIDNGVF